MWHSCRCSISQGDLYFITGLSFHWMNRTGRKYKFVNSPVIVYMLDMDVIIMVPGNDNSFPTPRPRSQNEFMYLIIFNQSSFHQQWNSSLSLQFNSVSQFLQYIHAHFKLTIRVACESSFNIHRTIILWNMIRFRPIPKRRTTIFPVIDRFMVCKKWQFMGCSIPYRWRDMGTYN